VSDVAFIALTIAVFAVMALVVRGMERLVGSGVSSERTDSLGGEQHTAHPGAGSSTGSSDGVAGADAVGVAAPPDGQVVR
jgi:hypothetical protein